jgi:hypothetical protein
LPLVTVTAQTSYHGDSFVLGRCGKLPGRQKKGQGYRTGAGY